MSGWSLLPRTHFRSRSGARRHPFAGPFLEELESRTVLDATTGVFTTGSFTTLGPALVSNDLLSSINSSAFLRFGPFVTAAGTSPFNVNHTAVVLGAPSPAPSLQPVGGLPATTLPPGTLNSGRLFGGTVPPSASQ